MTAALLLLAAALAAAPPADPVPRRPADPPAPPPPAAESLELTAGWRTRPDPRRAGVAGRWDGISLDDRHWAAVSLGGTATGRGGWWRRWVDLPGDWPRVWIAIDGAAPRTDLFINGTPATRDFARLALSSGAAVRDITPLVHGRRRFLVALMADRAPARVRVAAAPDGWLADGMDRLRVAAQAAPDLPWPSWLRGEGTAWTAYAPFAGGPAGRLGWKGDLEAGGELAGVSCWVWDRAARRLMSGPALPAHLTQVRLAERTLPLPEVRIGGEVRAIRLTVRVWPHATAGDDPLTVGVAEATLENLTGHPREVDLLVAVHPFLPAGRPAAIGRIRYDRGTQTFLVGERPACVLAGAPDAAGTGPFGAAWDVVAGLARGEFPAEADTVDPAGLATGVAAYRLRLQPYGYRTQTFRVLPGAPAGPLTAGQSRAIRELDRRSARADEETAWRRALAGKDRLFLRVPDKFAQDAFHASLGHLLVARAAGDPAADTAEVRAALTCAGIAAIPGDGTVGPPAAAAFQPPVADADPGTTVMTEAWATPAGLAPGVALLMARAAIARGEADVAGRILSWWLAHPTMPGTQAWSERVDPVTFRHAGGSLPDPVVAAGLVLAVRTMVLREADGALWLASALPADWVKPGSVVDIRHAPTAYGILPGFALRATPAGLELRRVTAEQLAFRGRGPKIPPDRVAQPPEGYRWRISGKRRIRQVRVDGTTRSAIPADRIVVLSPDFRRAFIGW